MPRLAAFFERGSALKLAWRGHPYDFVDTYEVLRAAYGYRSHYVNLGLWQTAQVADSGAMDPATRLVRFLMERSGLSHADRVLDVGSGLGQGALDLQHWLSATRVVGINVNPRQLAFANALAAASARAGEVQHQAVDACTGLGSAFLPASFDAAFAVECIGHFKDPAGFFAGLATVLANDAPFVCCLNVAKQPLPPLFRAMMRATYGFVPRSLAFWLETIARSGLVVTAHGDITGPVLADGVAAVQARLLDETVRRSIPPLTGHLVKRQLAMTESAVGRGLLGYSFIVAHQGHRS